MIPDCFQPGDSKPSAGETSGSQIELQGQMTETLRELYDLLEEYAPAWYPQQLHEKVESLLRLLEK
jgi:hypothetical protein